MPTAIAIQVLPLGTLSKEELYSLVDCAIAELKRPGLTVTVGPFETVVEGPEDLLWDVMKAAHHAVLRHHPACATYIKVFTAPNLGTSEEKTSRHRS